MPKLLSCVHGHQWTLPANFDTQPGVEQLCPQCGTPASHQEDTGSSVTVDLETRAMAAVAADTAPIQPDLQNLSGYDLIEELGRGGMGVVYRAYDLRRRHIVARVDRTGYDAITHVYVGIGRALKNPTR